MFHLCLLILKIKSEKLIIIYSLEKDVKKINIAICDNNNAVIESISKMIEDFSESRHIDIQYSTFYDYNQLRYRINEFDLFILDYNMSDNGNDSVSENRINGLEFAKLIRQHSEKKGIIFITAYPEFVYESFEVRAYRFFVKPIKKEKMFDAIQSFLNSTSESGKILININKEMHPVDIDKTLYLEVSGKRTFIYTENGVIKCRKSISSFEEDLSEYGFYRVHRSYLVNINKIKQFDTRTLILDNGEKIFISQKCYPGLCELYLQTKNNNI